MWLEIEERGTSSQNFRNECNFCILCVRRIFFEKINKIH